DYAEIRHHMEGKWHDWDKNNPPSEYIELGGGERFQYERPDVWIRPSESIVLSAKAASIGESDQFAVGLTLRFPRFRRLRLDRAWDTALNVDEFKALRKRVDDEAQEKKEMRIEGRRRRPAKRAKKELVIAGTAADAQPAFAGPRTKVFDGLEFCVLSEALKPAKRTKAQLEAIIKENGGRVSQRADPASGMLLIADKRVVKVASLIKGGDVDMIRPNWLLDCLAQNDEDYLLPYEERHLFHATEAMRRIAEKNTDEYGDSYARDVDVEELREILGDWPKIDGRDHPFDKEQFLDQLEEHGHTFEGPRGAIFRRCRICFSMPDENGVMSDLIALKLKNYVRFGGGVVTEELEDEAVTHVVIVTGADEASERERAAEVRHQISSRRRVPRVVTRTWIEECWTEKTLVDEEAYAPA
ncbi:MAG: hypothetical protein OK454_06945, partial [Thaumarchaeota archaeon]|nr:hypothetical protein [Nitrososphaerota archaeon]